MSLLANCEERKALHVLEVHLSIHMVDGMVSICFWHPLVKLEHILQILTGLSLLIFQLSIKQNLALWGYPVLCNSG